MSVDATSPRVNIVSLGAGFDTLFFRLLEQRKFAGMVSFTEVDCDAIVSAKTKLLNDPVRQAGLFPKDIGNLIVVTSSDDDEVAWQCQVSSGSYSLIACDLGDIQRLEATLNAAGVERSLPTLILGECVLVRHTNRDQCRQWYKLPEHVVFCSRIWHQKRVQRCFSGLPRPFHAAPSHYMIR